MKNEENNNRDNANKIEDMSDIRLAASGNDQGYVQLPVNDEQFKKFISGLLGSPQAIEKHLEGQFELKPDDVNDLYQLLFQRIARQNSGMLAKFVAKIRFSDESSVELSSLAEMMTFNQVKPVVAEQIVLVWDFLIQFPGKTANEKQRVFIDIDTRTGLMVSPNRVREITCGTIDMRIEYTDRTWGDDIEALLSNHFKTLLRENIGWRKTLIENQRVIVKAVQWFLAISSLVASLIAMYRFANNRLAEANDLLKSLSDDSLEQINPKLDYLMQFSANGAWYKYLIEVALFIGVMLMLSTMVSWILRRFIVQGNPSFLLLTKESQKHRDDSLLKLERRWSNFVATGVVSIVLGIVSNVLFTLLFGK